MARHDYYVFGVLLVYRPGLQGFMVHWVSLQNFVSPPSSYISTTRRFVRVIWLWVVATGFVCSGILISQAFESWAASPISTTIETLPIELAKFPQISVCPPKNTFTNLNYDLSRVENMTYNDSQREEMSQYITQPIYDANFADKYSEVGKLINIGVSFTVTFPLVYESKRERQISKLVFWTVNNLTDED